MTSTAPNTGGASSGIPATSTSQSTPNSGAQSVVVNMPLQGPSQPGAQQAPAAQGPVQHRTAAQSPADFQSAASATMVPSTISSGVFLGSISDLHLTPPVIPTKGPSAPDLGVGHAAYIFTDSTPGDGAAPQVDGKVEKAANEPQIDMVLNPLVSGGKGVEAAGFVEGSAGGLLRASAAPPSHHISRFFAASRLPVGRVFIGVRAGGGAIA